MPGFGGFKGDISLPAASGVNSAADGIYTLEEAAALRKMGRWPLIQRVVTVTGQPSNQTLTSGAATFSVTANVNEGGTLTYQWYRQALGTGSFSAISGATTASLVLSGLTRETNEADGYRVVISAVGAQSVTSDTATLLVPAANTPDAPTNVVGVVGNEQVALTWSAPANTGGAAITDYVIQYSSNTGTTWSTFSDSTSTATSVTVTGLTNDTAYLFRVAAVNIAGNGAWSANSSSVTPLALVFAITEQPENNFSTTYTSSATFGVAATGFGTLSYQWEGYYYDYNTGNYGWNSLGTASTFSLAGNTSSNYGIDTYSTGGMMQLRVVVTDSADSSTRTSQTVRWVDYSMVSPYVDFYGYNYGYPSGTTNVNGTNYANLSLQEDEGIYVSVYDYGYSSFDTSWYSSNAFTIKLQSSSNATTWTDVETFNYRGSGFYLNTSVAASFGVVYYRVLVTENWPLTVTNGTQSATRTAPQIVAGAYKVTWPPRVSKIIDTYLGMDVMATQRNTNIVDTYLGVDVMATQNVTNIVDTYLGVDVLCAVGSTLGAPINLVATAGDGEIAATWSAPGYDGGSSITDYTVQYSDDAGVTWTTFSDSVSTTRAVTITGLANGSTYKIRVAAVNADGTGPYVTSGSYALVALPVITQQPKNDYATTSTQQITFSVTATIATGDLTYQWQYYGADYNNGDYDYRWRNISDATAASYVATGNIMSNLLSYDFYYTGTAQLRCAISASGGGAPKYTVAARFMQLDNLHYPSTNWYGNSGAYTDWGGSFQTMSPQSGESLIVSVYDYAMSSPDTSWYTGNDTTLKIQVATTGATSSADWTDLYTVNSRGYVYLPSYEITPDTGTKYYRVIAVNKWPYATNNGTSSVAHETQYVYPYDSSSVIRVTWP